VSSRYPKVELLNWPVGTEPQGAAVFTHNAVKSTATPEQVWSLLIRAADWPRWYPNSWSVLLPGGAVDLSREMIFGWTTFANAVTSRVEVFEPPHRLEWAWWRAGGHGYHRWSVAPASGGGTRVVTEETHRGRTPKLLAPALQPALALSHEIWLRELARRAPRQASPG
jgi:uncharacterized protein YndB with AHSA1/START domain